MRSYSTPESAHRGEVTKLAILEAFASVALYVWFCIRQGSWRSLSVVVAFAPFMLFRTDRSAAWALGYWQRWVALLDPVVERMTSAKDLTAAAGFVLLFAYLWVTPVVGVVLRVTSTLYWVFTTLPDTVREAPWNWVRQTLCTDFAHLPELVPLEALRGDVGELRRYLGFIRHRERVSVKLWAHLLPRWTPEKRPVVDGAKPASGSGPKHERSTAFIVIEQVPSLR